MSTVMNAGIKMSCKVVMTIFTVSGLLIEISAATEKPRVVLINILPIGNHTLN